MNKAQFESLVQKQAKQIVDDRGLTLQLPQYECDDDTLLQTVAVFDARGLAPKHSSGELVPKWDGVCADDRVEREAEKLVEWAVSEHNRQHRRLALLSEVERPTFQTFDDMQSATIGRASSAQYKLWQQAVGRSS